VIYYTCDMCGKRLAGGRDLRFVAKIQLYAAADPLEISAEELTADIREKIRRLVDEMKDMDPQELQDSVFRQFQFDLCPKCRQRYIEDPLPQAAPSSAPRGHVE